MYKKGRSFEYFIKEKLEKRGFYVIRSAGSHTLFDLIAISDTKILLIQCKKYKNMTFKRANSLLNSIAKTFHSFVKNDYVLICLAFVIKRKTYLAIFEDEDKIILEKL